MSCWCSLALWSQRTSETLVRMILMVNLNSLLCASLPPGFLPFLSYFCPSTGHSGSAALFHHNLNIGAIISLFCDGLKEQIESRIYFYRNSRLVRSPATWLFHVSPTFPILPLPILLYLPFLPLLFSPSSPFPSSPTPPPSSLPPYHSDPWGTGPHFGSTSSQSWQFPWLCGGAGSEAVGLHCGIGHWDQWIGGWKCEWGRRVKGRGEERGEGRGRVGMSKLHSSFPVLCASQRRCRAGGVITCWT